MPKIRPANPADIRRPLRITAVPNSQSPLTIGPTSSGSVPRDKARRLGIHTVRCFSTLNAEPFYQASGFDAPGSPDNYAAFAASITACNRAGGGKVIVPAGDWYCAGPITLLSNVNFHLRSGAQIWFSPNPADYAKYGPYDFGPNGKLVHSRWQGNDCYNFSPMVYAYGQHNSR